MSPTTGSRDRSATVEASRSSASSTRSTRPRSPRSIGILQTREFDNQRFYGWSTADPAARKALAGSIRQFWEKTRSVPLAERWYRTLLDDSAGPARWLEAAAGIVQRDPEPGTPFPKARQRAHEGRAVASSGATRASPHLMLRRARQIEGMEDSPGSRELGLTGACQMGSVSGRLG